ncbi:MAG: M16 family metallopeptidase [Bacillota bacterium]|uniref:Insulinase family protein n=1 Tax=Thermanaerosceptrum fracticalcis TaxID=1712410 RepID=A0A7G6E0V9_THEFR|nr:pitrilysin family protein [Thermanaerosceptrum fracticalcis]QNB45713.1 insulinase family protein [Thermanaerosceptrum fracticalcis]
MHTNDFVKIQLDNGVRIVTEKVPVVRSVALGIWVGAGSRHENEKIAGISHFIEHLMFKGTENRSASDIAEALDAVGGQLNAFTTKEFTCYYAKILDEHFDLALDVLSDMFFNSTFTEKAIEKERGVIEEEIKMYEDTPDELIHDLFVQTAWPDHPLGKPILGTVNSLEAITRNDIINYMDKHYTANNIVVAVAGNIDHQTVQNKIARIFAKIKPAKKPEGLVPPRSTHADTSNISRDTGQVQICLGTAGLPQGDERIYSVYILNNVLGGGLSSRLVQSIREERGLAYSVYSYHSAFCDTGLFTFYAGTSPAKYDEVIRLLIKEVSDIMENGITERELRRTQEQIKGNLYLGLESVSSRMTRIGRTELCLNRIITPEEVVKRISAVTLEDVKSIANTLFNNYHFTLSTIGPLEKPVNLHNFLR